MYAHAIAQVEPPAIGVHLIWMGPRPWIYSVRGWSIQRRRFIQRGKEMDCDGLNVNNIALVRSEREMRLRFGTLTMQEGSWPTSIVPQAQFSKVPSTIAIAVPPSCEIFTLELDELQTMVKIQVNARASFAIALREGKSVATGGTVFGSASYDLHAIAIDTVIVYTLVPSLLNFCIPLKRKDEEKEWEGEPFIIKNLSLPLQELMPSLHSPDEEFAEGKNRLLLGEVLDEEEFKRLANTIRAGVQRANPPRPIDQVLLMRENSSADFEELVALDPIRVLLSHPKWRRVLGFGCFDNDPSLIIGETYEYRITGLFPAEDLNDTFYGFHTIPSQSALPAEFYLHDLRLRLPQPVTVERAPGTPDSDLIQISRRGIQLRPQNQHFWLLPSLEDWSLVIDFPSPISSVILELHEDHDLEYVWGTPPGPLNGPVTVPSGSRPLMHFPSPIEQLRLRGKGFLFAVRIPAGPKGLKPVSMVLPPVTLMNMPPPQPPLMARIINLQQPQPVPTDDTPPAVLPPRNTLGFEIKWRPTLRNGLSIWPSDQRAAPPLDAAIYRLEHCQLALSPVFPMEILTMLGELSDASLRSGASAWLSLYLRPELIDALNRIPLPERKRKILATAVATRDVNTILTFLLVPSGWTSVLPEENLTLGDRDEMNRDTQVFPGVDLMTLFPEGMQRSSGAGLDIYWRDVFDFKEGGNPVLRPVPSPGTYHQYRVAAVDSIGRQSLTWQMTNILRLEKHVPPPVPVGPDETPADQLTLPAPVGVQARILVRNAPDLTTADQATLGTDNNVVILRWGWHTQQRDQDPFAKEFRIYVAKKPLDSVAGTLASVAPLGPGLYNVILNLDRPVIADAAKGSNFQAGYPFYIRTHTAGFNITATLEAGVPNPNGNLPEPTLGPILLPLHLTPDLTRPPAWSERVEVQPITVETQYDAVIRNLLILTPIHPRDSIWIGVSAADDQSYVSDQLAPIGTRSGNESAIVPVLCEARYHGRPIFDIPPSLDPVPVLVTPEPVDRPIFFSIDLSPYLVGSGLLSTDLIRPERVPADNVFAAYYITVDNRIMARVVDRHDNSETESEVTIANPVDRAAVIAALKGDRTDALDDRFVVFLAGSHPYRDRFFEPATQIPVPFGLFQETLPPKSGRYVYRIRKSDASGHLSAGGALAKVIVRVPSMAPGAAPDKEQAEGGDAPGTLRLQIAPEPELTHVLTFSQLATSVGGPVEEAELLRVPNAGNLYPNNGIRLRTPDGALLAPQVKALSDPDVIIDTNGFRRIVQTFSAGAGERVRVWACTLTRDGIPSLLGGPWSLAMPVAPLPIPTLAVMGVTDLVFTWSWPSGPTYNVALERSSDSTIWERVSQPIAEKVITHEYFQPAGSWQYRLRVMSPDGRTAYSNTVIP